MTLDDATHHAANCASIAAHLSMAALAAAQLVPPGLDHLALAGAALLLGLDCYYSAQVTRLCRWHYCLTALRHGGEHTAMVLCGEWATLVALERAGLVQSADLYLPARSWSLTALGRAALEE